ncbi:MAG: hypothetical protein NVSMB47_07980 [Polyangiales bacterium]
MLRSFLRPRALRSALAIPALFVAVACGKTSGDGGAPQPPAGACPAREGCTEPSNDVRAVRFTPSSLVVAVGETRPVRAFIEPDVCAPTSIGLTVDQPSVARVDAKFDADACHAETLLPIAGLAPGHATITAQFGSRTATLDVFVATKDPVACGAPGGGNVGPGTSVTASGATLAIQPGAALDAPAPDTQWGVRNDPLDKPSSVAPFDATLACADVAPPDGMTALGPAITFGPIEKRFLRDVVFELPINPARMPPTAKLRHVRVLYSSTTLKDERFVAIANPRFEQRDGNRWVLRFEAPRLGTYRAVVASDAGTHKKKRHLTHRAVFGFSMGGIGASMFGMNHHDLFDVVAPLGGPLDATFFLWYFKQYHFGGFCPRKAGDPAPATPCHADVGAPTELYEHVQDYEHWWHHDLVSGTGGTFPRSEYIDIFRDVSAMWGDPASNNPKFPAVASGIDAPLPFDAKVADYCDDPAKATIAATGYYDKTFNPDGALPVIKYCDGANVGGKPTAWAPGGKQPVEVATALDLNKNGKRDEGEPVITQAYEPYDDVGADGLADKDEPGYDAVNDPDPNGDDYDFQYNPLGAENNHHREEAEHFDDLGIDGVACPTPGGCAFDLGEGDGKYTMTAGLQTFNDRDGRSQMLGWAPPPPGGEWTDAALDQLDYYSDGGIRDIFNWAMIGDHYSGAFAARKRPLVYYNDWLYLPGVNATDNDHFDQKTVDWTALPQATYMRYGSIDASRRDIDKGDGQHVGGPDQVVRRILTALFYIGSRWPDADTAYYEDPPETDDPDPCGGNRLACTFDFKAADGRTGPTTVIVPPGYWSDAAKGVKYPVTYFLHGYGQTPEDLKALVLLVSPLMGQGLSSRATRLQKMIMVFVDGRCRTQNGSPECVNGTFYVDSVRKEGPQIDHYFLDLMKYVDGKYRTLPPTDIEVPD